jgi:hypothetical protein
LGFGLKLTERFPRGLKPTLYCRATSFEVRESGGGTSNLSFDYRIVAKRRGYEAQRLTEVTDRFKTEIARATPHKVFGGVRDSELPQPLHGMPQTGTPSSQNGRHTAAEKKAILQGRTVQP